MKKVKKKSVLKELREIREKLSVEYWQNPEKLREDLKAVRDAEFLPKEKEKKTK